MSRPPPFLAGGLVGAIALLAVFLVLWSLQREDLPTFSPTPPGLRQAGDALVGPVLYTLDTSAPDEWRYFSFAEGSSVVNPGPRGWDLAFRRFNVMVNGGSGFAGVGGVLDLGPVEFESVTRAPADGYEPTVVRRDTVNAAIERWYRYGFTTHLLTPKPHVYVLRTADGRFAKLELLSYYCPGALPGCVTFRYVFQGGGGADFTGPPSAPALSEDEPPPPGPPPAPGSPH